MSGSAQDPVELAPDSSPSAIGAGMDSYSNKKPRSEGEPLPFRQGLAAFQYQAPSLSNATSQATGELSASSMVHNVPTIPMQTGSMIQSPLPLAPAPMAQRSAAAPSDSILQIKATRLARLFSSYTVDQCMEVLRTSNYDLGEAIEKLRPKKVAPPPPAPVVMAPRPVQPLVPTPAPAPAAAPARAPKRPAKRKSRAMSDSDTDGSVSLDDASSDEEEFGDVDERTLQQQQQALTWFNTCEKSSLVDTINCSPEQADTIISLRPFDTVDEVHEKLGDKSAKGVSPRLFTNCVELMAGYMEVDEVLAKCETIGSQISEAMSSWRTKEEKASDEGAGALSFSQVQRDGTKRENYLDKQPSNLADGVVLKDYQLIGISWLNLLYRKDTSCILADEMGLGKTCQVISFLAHLKETTKRKGPHLIVAPSSVLENWSREFQRFCPALKVEVYYGSQAERRDLRIDLKHREDYDVILTTYDMATGSHDDQSFLRKRGFDVCVFDEGHMLKNRKSQKYAKLLRISGRWRLLLTGTPLQNNLQELVSLLNFILPDYFTDVEEALAAIFKVKQGASTTQLSQQRVERAKRMMQPFVLRRRKDQVLRGLTQKTERIELCDMTERQAELYKSVLQRTSAALMEEPSGKKGAAKDTTNVLMDLRKAANHPLLFRALYDEKKIAALARDYIREPEHAEENLQYLREDFAINTDAELSLLARSWKSTQKHMLPEKAWMDSGKIVALRKIIDEVVSKGDRMLIFSQFTSVLDILCVCLELMGVKYVGFTGQTNVGDRQHLVDQFTNDPSIPVFLLSTRAGGLGINLVAANWVVLFDQDFNPQNDKQATDRCYRIGQTKPVTVVKLISRGTIDEDVLSLAQRKLELAERVSGQASAEGDEDQLESEMKSQITSSLLAQVRERAGTSSS
ncbi:DNA helicase [Malassezia equina]|uniref:DNA helicase n=1 Tax=Malassezia equina TaxID=1381935 RepID=A0AAF0EAZ1_9BASI|nr:DNA helicase [Malassezia equina]